MSCPCFTGFCGLWCHNAALRQPSERICELVSPTSVLVGMWGVVERNVCLSLSLTRLFFVCIQTHHLLCWKGFKWILGVCVYGGGGHMAKACEQPPFVDTGSFSGLTTGSAQTAEHRANEGREKNRAVTK